MQPRRVFFESCKEFLEPAVFVAVVERTGPDAELFHVIAHGGHMIRVRPCGFLQVVNHLLDGSEGNQITKNLLPRDEAYGLAVIFRDVIGKKFLRFKAGREEVNVIKHGVADIGFRKHRSELWLPYTFGEPGARGALAEMMLEIVGKPDQLHPLVSGWDRNENGLVKAAADHFHLTVFH